MMNSGFGSTPSRRNEPQPAFEVGNWNVDRDVDDFVSEFDDSARNQPPINLRLLDMRQASKTNASQNFVHIMLSIGALLGCELSAQSNVPSRSPLRANVDASENAAMLASLYVQRADYVLRVDGRWVVVVEMKKPCVFRRSATAHIPNLCIAAQRAFGSSSTNEIVILVEHVFQLYRYMRSMKLGYGILSSFDLTFLVRREGHSHDGETLWVSRGIASSDSRFLGSLAYMVYTSMNDPKEWEILDMKHAGGGSSHAFGLGGSQNQGSEGESERHAGKKRGPHQGLHIMRTRSHGLPVCRETPGELCETPAKLLHLEQHHFAEGWSGRIVRGTYEGERIVVKLAPTGSDRAEALLTEVVAYHKLKEFWGKYVPRLVSYGTTAGGKGRVYWYRGN